jgi:hypothetical protein
MTVITQTATASRFTRLHTRLEAFRPVQPLSAQMEPTVSVSIEAGLARIMGALLNGSNPVAFPWALGASFAMQEVLSKTCDTNVPLREQEFFELSLFDMAHELGTRYSVRQAHAQWDDKDGQVMWDQEEVDHFWILGEARKRYAERRLALAQQGFIYSDMDLF